jgi:hypothetical protein
MPRQTDESPVLDLLTKMTMDSIEASSLDAKTLMLVRIASSATKLTRALGLAIDIAELEEAEAHGA